MIYFTHEHLSSHTDTGLFRQWQWVGVCEKGFMQTAMHKWTMVWSIHPSCFVTSEFLDLVKSSAIIQPFSFMQVDLWVSVSHQCVQGGGCWTFFDFNSFCQRLQCKCGRIELCCVSIILYGKLLSVCQCVPVRWGHVGVEGEVKGRGEEKNGWASSC